MSAENDAEKRGRTEQSERTEAAPKSHNVNESADKIRVETKVKRGTGTRDQDEIKVQVKGDDPDDVVSRLDATVKNLRGTATTVRRIQPDDEQVCFRFAGTPSEGLEFVETENEDGEGIGVGEWVEDGEYWILKIGGESDGE